MRLLLDTHALLRWLAGDAKLAARAPAGIADEANAVSVSAASGWEIGTKNRLGKLPQAADLVLDLARVVDSQGFVPLDITVGDGHDAGLLASSYRDSFDRMLAAQARRERLVIVSTDQVFDRMREARLW